VESGRPVGIVSVGDLTSVGTPSRLGRYQRRAVEHLSRQSNTGGGPTPVVAGRSVRSIRWRSRGLGCPGRGR
jgi:hypothetical protein